MIEFFDPNTWAKDDHEYRIYADDYANDYAIVDAIDYHYLVQWRWKISPSRIWPGTKKPKIYLGRAVPTIVGPDIYENGKRRQQRVTSTVYLHKVVMERKGTPRPNTNKHLIVDHANSDGLDCRRDNLRWATISFNNKNRHGVHERTLFEEQLTC